MNKYKDKIGMIKEHAQDIADHAETLDCIIHNLKDLILGLTYENRMKDVKYTKKVNELIKVVLETSYIANKGYVSYYSYDNRNTKLYEDVMRPSNPHLFKEKK